MFEFQSTKLFDSVSITSIFFIETSGYIGKLKNELQIKLAFIQTVLVLNIVISVF